MSRQKTITSNGGELLVARMMWENLALVYEDRTRSQSKRVIITTPREYWELHDYIEQHGAPRPSEMLAAAIAKFNYRRGLPDSCTPGRPSAPMQAGAQDNGESITPPSLPNTTVYGEAGNLSSQPTK